jgi:cell division transport system permease protein
MTLQRLIRETIIGFRSSILLSALSMLTVATSLFLIGIFFLFHINLNQIMIDLDRRVQMIIYLRDDAPRDAVERIRVDLFENEAAKSAIYVGKEEALVRVREELREDSILLENLSVNPLPPSLEVDFKEGYLREEVVLSLAESLKGNGSVESVDYGGMWLSKLRLVRTLITAISGVGGVVLLAIAIVVIGSAIRMAVFSRRTELLVMKMVGSTDWTIEGPFLVEGLIKGAVGGTLAAVLSDVVYRLVDSRLIGLAPVPAYYYVGVIALGIVLGITGTFISIKGQLRKLW